MFVNPRDQWGFQFVTDYCLRSRWLYYEPYERSLFTESVRANPGAVVVDIGASYGFFTLDTCWAINADHVRRMIAIEPDRDTCYCLERSLEASGYTDRVLVVNAAATDRHGVKCPFFRHEAVSGWNKLVNEGTDYTSTYEVPGVTLDGLLDDSGIEKTGTFIIKIDIEGGEPQALRGMRETLRSADGFIMFSEFHPPTLRLSGNDAVEYAAALLDLEPTAMLEIDELGRKISVIRNLDDFQRIIQRCLDATEWWNSFTNVIICKNASLAGIEKVAGRVW